MEQETNVLNETEEVVEEQQEINYADVLNNIVNSLSEMGERLKNIEILTSGATEKQKKEIADSKAKISELTELNERLATSINVVDENKSMFDILNKYSR